MTSPLLRVDDCGLFCEAGGFHIDPWRPVPRAVVSHGHGDHARPGSGSYLSAASGVPILQRRLGAEASIEGVPVDTPVRIGDVTVSFHPAGHIPPGLSPSGRWRPRTSRNGSSTSRTPALAIWRRRSRSSSTGSAAEGPGRTFRCPSG
ncbi:MAG TPA: hypothetical protein VKM72_24140 [Thermoanaerobaculia bacterium]|nr:hypothetical protein [Thermoanaerobaculia bacterium]